MAVKKKKSSVAKARPAQAVATKAAKAVVTKAAKAAASTLVATLTGPEGFREKYGKAWLTALRLKTKRRALRHFRGKEVTHRVVEKSANSISFAYFRGSGKPVSIRWRMKAA